MRLGKVVVAVLLAFGCTVIGCGPKSVTKAVTPPGQEQIKPILEGIAEKGELDSGLMAVRDQLEAMKNTDAAKADALLKDLDELQKLRDPAQIKSKAKQMAGKL